MAILAGAGAGALHAVTGPDHVLSMGPVAMRQRHNAWRIGLRWGAGHALGTLLLSLPALLLSQLFQLSSLATWGERAAGLTLCVTALLSLRAVATPAQAQHSAEARGTLVVGFLHGLTGAGSLLLVLPMLITGSLPRTLLFLGAFAVGSTWAMALLTWFIGRVGGALSVRAVDRSRIVLSIASFALGLCWLVAA